MPYNLSYVGVKNKSRNKSTEIKIRFVIPVNIVGLEDWTLKTRKDVYSGLLGRQISAKQIFFTILEGWYLVTSS